MIRARFGGGQNPIRTRCAFIHWQIHPSETRDERKIPRLTILTACVSCFGDEGNQSSSNLLSKAVSCVWAWHRIPGYALKGNPLRPRLRLFLRQANVDSVSAAAALVSFALNSVACVSQTRNKTLPVPIFYPSPPPLPFASQISQVPRS